jgi:hypothetical protein
LVGGPLGLGTTVAGCAAGAAGLGALGALTGAVVVTIPVAVGAGINYLVQSQSPFVAPAPAK